MCVHAPQIAAMFRPVPTAPGHDVFPQGAHADCLYVLQDGEVTNATSWSHRCVAQLSTIVSLACKEAVTHGKVVPRLLVTTTKSDNIDVARCSWQCTETRLRSSASAPLTSWVSNVMPAHFDVP